MDTDSLTQLLYGLAYLVAFVVASGVTMQIQLWIIKLIWPDKYKETREYGWGEKTLAIALIPVLTGLAFLWVINKAIGF